MDGGRVGERHRRKGKSEILWEGTTAGRVGRLALPTYLLWVTE